MLAFNLWELPQKPVYEHSLFNDLTRRLTTELSPPYCIYFVSSCKLAVFFSILFTSSATADMMKMKVMMMMMEWWCWWWWIFRRMASLQEQYFTMFLDDLMRILHEAGLHEIESSGWELCVAAYVKSFVFPEGGGDGILMHSSRRQTHQRALQHAHGASFCAGQGQQESGI